LGQKSSRQTCFLRNIFSRSGIYVGKTSLNFWCTYVCMIKAILFLFFLIWTIDFYVHLLNLQRNLKFQCFVELWFSIKLHFDFFHPVLGNYRRFWMFKKWSFVSWLQGFCLRLFIHISSNLPIPWKSCKIKTYLEIVSAFKDFYTQESTFVKSFKNWVVLHYIFPLLVVKLSWIILHIMITMWWDSIMWCDACDDHVMTHVKCRFFVV
jgi:hypothetical protein